MLDVRLAVRTGRAEVERVTLANEVSQLWGDLVGPPTPSFHARIGSARTESVLLGLDGRREGDVAHVSGHDRVPPLSTSVTLADVLLQELPHQVRDVVPVFFEGKVTGVEQVELERP